MTTGTKGGSNMTQRQEQDQQLALKRQQNANASISKLPNEILLDIFVGLNAVCSLKDFHQAAQVCHHWRALALDAPILWTNPPVHLHQYTLCMLERSKNAPLTIHIGARAQMDTIKAVLRHARRIRSLACIALSARQLQSIQKMLVDSVVSSSASPTTSSNASSIVMPLLEELTISPLYHASHTFRLDSPAFCPPAGRLRRLSLTAMDLRWDLLLRVATSSPAPAAPGPGLTALHLNFMCMSQRVGWDELFALLRAAPGLQELTMTLESVLDGSAPPPDSDSGALSLARERVPMRCLRYLSLQHGTEEAQVQGILARLDCPALCVLKAGWSPRDWHGVAPGTGAGTEGYQNTDVIRTVSDTIEAGAFGDGLEAVDVNGSFMFQVSISRAGAMRATEDDDEFYVDGGSGGAHAAGNTASDDLYAICPLVQLMLPFGEDKDADERLFTSVFTGIKALSSPVVHPISVASSSSSAAMPMATASAGTGAPGVIELSLRLPFDYDQIAAIFGSSSLLPCLRNLTVTDYTAVEFVKAFMLRRLSLPLPESMRRLGRSDEASTTVRNQDAAAPTMDSSTMPFAALESLTVDLDGLEKMDEVTVVNGLSEALMQRQEVGQGLKELVLQGMTKYDIAGLRRRFQGLVGTVDVSRLEKGVYVDVKERFGYWGGDVDADLRDFRMVIGAEMDDYESE